MPDLILLNARVVTLNDRQPRAEAVAVRGERIMAVGSAQELGDLSRPNTKVIDCQGQILVPGFIDAHCHIMAFAASMLDVDCSPSAASSIQEIKRAVKKRALDVPRGEWIRGRGYDEFSFEAKRHPSRWDLDEAAPDHPVRLDHRSGHACVLNSKALSLVGIAMDTPDPKGGFIERDSESGAPTGLLLEMDEHLEGRLPPLSQEAMRRGVHSANQRLVSLGVTSVQDATPSNSVERWDAFGRLKADGTLWPRVTMMVGSRYLEEFLDRGLRFRSGDADLNLGAVKVMLTTTTGSLHPSRGELADLTRMARESGFQVAIHAVEAEAVDAAADALISARGTDNESAPTSEIRDRIEHCSECPPDTLDKLAGSGIAVVTQPGFLYYSGQRYLDEVPERIQPWLYRINSFATAGLTPAASSDAPVIDPDPMIGIYAAVTRRAKSGDLIGPSEGVSACQALRQYTLNGAYAAFQESDKGSVEVGKLADLALLDADPTVVEAEQIRRIRVTMTIIGGQIVWQA